MPRDHCPDQRMLTFEQHERRLCLSTVGFALHDMDCCAAHSVRSTATGDLDGDGDLDVLSTSSYRDSKLVWYKNTDGAGTFGFQRVIAKPGASSVAAADLDGDGDLDVLAGSFGKIVWHPNLDGKGQFGLERAIVTETRGIVVLLAAVDVDLDGDLDLVAATSLAIWYGQQSIAWYENLDGQGHFGPERLISTENAGGESVAVADLDGDGDVDIVASSKDLHRIEWYENELEADIFSAPQLIVEQMYVGMSVGTADVDGDGDVDVLSTSSFDSSLNWYENLDGQGTFDSQKVVDSLAEGTGINYVAAGDLDGDGDIDLLVAMATYEQSKVAWYENTAGAGAFRSHTVFTDVTGVVLSAVDLDRDGDMDLLTHTGEVISWYVNSDGRGTFELREAITLHVAFFRTIQAADIDRDGDLDALVASNTYETGAIAWYENTDGRGAFGPRQVIAILNDWRTTAQAVDIDGDGDLDVLSDSSYASDHTIGWYENSDGQGTFGPIQAITSLAAFRISLRATDVDGDGDADVVLAASYFDRTIAWYENTDGNGAFGRPQVIAKLSRAGGGDTSIEVADVDGDGDQDLLSAAFSTGDVENQTIAWYENLDGRGTFGPRRIVFDHPGDSGSIDSLKAADLDGDDDLDIVFASQRFRNITEATVSWYENVDGSGEFVARQSITIDSGQAVMAADVDSDGDLDLLAASAWNQSEVSTDDKIAWYENTKGRGTFGPERVFTTQSLGETVVAVADLDADGDIDVLAASSDDGRIAWYEQRLLGDVNRDNVFNAADLALVREAGEYEDAVFGNSTFGEGDFNGDGDFDAADLVFAFQPRHFAALPGDFDGNGAVDQADLDLVLLHWGKPSVDVPLTWLGPRDGGLIDQDDLDAVLLNWGPGAPRRAAIT